MPSRIRVVEGSCWSCKQRRIKCSLSKPQCRQCNTIGTRCEYGAVQLRWHTRPSPFQVTKANDPFSSLPLYQKRALDYFEACIWPLFSVESMVCAFPMSLAVQDRGILHAACVIADAHRYLLDRRHSAINLQHRRIDTLTTIRGQLQWTLNTPILPETEEYPYFDFLLAILLIFFMDGYIDCTLDSAATLSHHAGVVAVVQHLGGFQQVRARGNHALALLLSEFATADVSMALLRCTTPSFSSEIWDTICERPVWWAIDADDALGLSEVFRAMSDMAFYRYEIDQGALELSQERVVGFEKVLHPIYNSISTSTRKANGIGVEPLDLTLVHRLAFVHSFQNCASIYLYRALCGLPLRHHLVQQHVHGCVSNIIIMDKSAKHLSCVLLPVCVAGAHLQSDGLKTTLLETLDFIHQRLRFESIKSVKQWLSSLWSSSTPPNSWRETFHQLNSQAVIE